jgi:excisionase family DNA binding protein
MTDPTRVGELLPGVLGEVVDRAGTPREATELDTLLSVEQAAERLGTSARFVRRLIAERRITYVKLGRHVRIAEHDLINFVVTTGRVEAGRRLGA